MTFGLVFWWGGKKWRLPHQSSRLLYPFRVLQRLAWRLLYRSSRLLDPFRAFQRLASRLLYQFSRLLPL